MIKFTTRNTSHIFSPSGRLQEYRRRAEHYNNNPANWRKYRWERHHTIDKPYYYSPSHYPGERWMALSNFSLGEDLGKCHELTRSRATGWYNTPYQNEVIIPHVIRLRTSKGTLYIPGLEWSDSDGVSLVVSDSVNVAKGSEQWQHDEAIIETARTAEHIAERTAEYENENYMAEDIAERIREIESELKEQQSELKTACLYRQSLKRQEKTEQDVCFRMVQKGINSILSDIRHNLKTLEKCKNSPWEIYQ